MKSKSRLSEHIRIRTREWFKKAEHDLAYLEHSPFNEVDPPTDTACKLSHSVAEYSLKAYLMLNKRKIPKVHSLLELLDLCAEINTKVEAIKEYCEKLEPYKEEATYPVSPPIIITIEEAKEAIECAKK